MLRAEADGVVRRQPRLGRDCGDGGSCLVVVLDPRGVEGDARDRRLPGRKRDALVQLDELGERRDRVPRDPSISAAPAEWQRTKTCGAAPWTSPSVTPEYIGWTSEPWPSTNRISPPRRAPSTTSRSAAPARKSATTASTAIPQPAIAIPVWPVGTKTDASPRSRASRSSSTATVFLPIAQSEPTVRTIFASTSRFAPVGTLSPSGGLRRSRSSTPCARASAVSSASSETNSCRPLSTSSPAAMQPFRRSRHAGGKRPPCVATPTTATVGSYGAASATMPTIGMPSCASPGRFESRIATTGSGP